MYYYLVMNANLRVIAFSNSFVNDITILDVSLHRELLHWHNAGLLDHRSFPVAKPANQHFHNCASLALLLLCTSQCSALRVMCHPAVECPCQAAADSRTKSEGAQRRVQ